MGNTYIYIYIYINEYAVSQESILIDILFTSFK